MNGLRNVLGLTFLSAISLTGVRAAPVQEFWTPEPVTVLRFSREDLEQTAKLTSVTIEPDGRLHIGKGQTNALAWLDIADRQYVVWHRFGTTTNGCQRDVIWQGEPVVVISEQFMGWRYQQEVFGWSEGMQPGHQRFILVRIRVTNPSAGEYAYLRYLIRGGEETKTIAEWINPVLASRSEMSFFVRIPVVRATDASRIEEKEYNQCLAQARQYWKDPIVGRDRLGDEIFAGGEDPSFERIAGIYPELQYPREPIGVKEAPADCKVEPDGAIVIGRALPLDPANNENDVDKTPHAYFEVADSISQGTHTEWHRLGAKSQCKKGLLEGYLPVVAAEYSFDRLRWYQQAFGWSQGMSADVDLFTYIRLRVTNTDTSTKLVRLRLRVGDGKQDATAAQWDWELGPNASREVSFQLPLVSFMDRTVEVNKNQFDARLQEVCRFWNAVLGEGMEINVPEQRVNNAWRAWMIYNFLNVDKVKGQYEPHDGACFYEPIFGYSAGLYCRALDHWGYHREAELYLRMLRTAIQPDGLFTLNFGLPDTGVLLLAMSDHYTFTGDADWLRGAAPDMIRMCNWIINKRKEVMTSQPADSPVRGLIKFRPYCDDPVPAYSYFSDTYLSVGMDAAAKVLQTTGDAEQAARIAKEAQAYHADVLRSMERSVIERDGRKMLPMYPETHKLLKDNGYTARDYYSLVACNVLETGFLKPSDAPRGWIVDMLENRGGLQLGMCAFKWPHMFDEWKWYAIDHAYTYGYWMDALRHAEAHKVLLGFYGSLAYGMSRNTYAAAEVTQIRTGMNEPTLPHLYSNTQLLSLLRNMLVWEEGRDLLLCQAVPRGWLEPGKSIVVKRAPTRFGQISFELKSSDTGVVFSMDAPFRSMPERIQLRLRHPSKKALKSAQIDQGKAQILGSDTVEIQGAKQTVSLRVSFD